MDTSNPQLVTSDWFGNPLNPFATFTLRQIGEELAFQAAQSGPGLAHPHSEPSQFHEGLWEFDVAEVFLLEPETGRYLEINLAPNGAWWACWHSGIRKREITQPSFSAIRATGNNGVKDWEASILLPLTLFSHPEKLRYNVTFILNSPAQTFHSLAKLPGEQPDFHQPKHFLPLPSHVPS